MSDELYNGLEAEITSDGDVAEGQEDAALTILGLWLKGDSGAEFQQKFGGDSGQANLKRMLANIHTLGKYLSIVSLEDAYAAMKSAGSLEPTPPTPAEIKQQNQERWNAQAESFYRSRSSREVDEQAKTNPLFASWLKKRIASEIPVVELEYSPEVIARQKEVERLQKKRDEKYKGIPNDLIIFAQTYKKLKADEVKELMKIPQWRGNVDELAKHGLI